MIIGKVSIEEENALLMSPESIIGCRKTVSISPLPSFYSHIKYASFGEHMVLDTNPNQTSQHKHQFIILY